ncbi:MAG: PIG-L family deacetylase [Clostridia bacterium]|nr:PIG-L family deacetylase [Clostridia bacterium]
MKEEIYMPFYSIVDNKLVYLEKYTICELPKEENIRKKFLEDEGVILFKNKRNETQINQKILVLEPHPDDFSLSALGYINDNMQVIVLNIFSNMKLDSFTWKENISIDENKYEELRMRESKIAIEEILNYKFISLKEKSTRINKDNVKNIENKIICNLVNILENYEIDTLMIPMGIGNHPDHIAVYNAVMNNKIKLLDKNIKVVFYPEYPYARCKKSYIDRLEEIKQKYKLNLQIVNVEEKIENIVNCVAVYRSQYDDINKKQMLAIIREDCRAIATEYKKEKICLAYYELER